MRRRGTCRPYACVGARITHPPHDAHRSRSSKPRGAAASRSIAVAAWILQAPARSGGGGGPCIYISHRPPARRLLSVRAAIAVQLSSPRYFLSPVCCMHVTPLAAEGKRTRPILHPPTNSSTKHHVCYQNDGSHHLNFLRR